MSEPTTQAAPQVSTLECLDGGGQGIRALFQKSGDRFRHTIFSVRDGVAVPLLMSVEGTPNEVVPSSPPFAELHQQDKTLFLSGATTQGHWSMSVEVAEGRLLFDVACRAKSQASNLGSLYCVLAANYVLEPGDATESELGKDVLRISPLSQGASDYPSTLRWRYSLASKA